MPLIYNTSYKPPFYAFNQHAETIIPSTLRKIDGVNYERERISTHDDDFLDIDWLKSDNKRLIIISHGLEGSSERPYVKGLAKLMHANGYDCLAWNCRSCSGEINKTKLLYHHGFTVDLKTVVNRALQEDYDTIVMAGFSMGGSLTLKYLGEYAASLPKAIKAGMAISVPVDLASSSKLLALKKNKFYQDRFMKKLTKKMVLKESQFPGLLELRPWNTFDNFHEFDTHYSAKLFGYKDAADFYRNVQSLPYLEKIAIPTLLLNAWNDPMLSESCFPKQLAEKKQNLTLEITNRGGHVGFLQPKKTFTYAEERTLGFFNSIVN